MKYPKIILVLIAIALLIGSYFFLKNRKENPRDVKAGSAQESISSEAEWELGTTTNLDTTSLPGSFSIDQKGTSNVTGGTFDQFFEPCNPAANTPSYLADGDTLTPAHLCITGTWLEWTFPSEEEISQVRVMASEVDTDPFIAPRFSVKYWNGSDWTEIFQDTVQGGGVWSTSEVTPAITTSKIRLYHLGETGPGDDELIPVFEVELLKLATATHTSAATQIDGSEGGTKNFIEWETFTPTYTEPANTNVKFRFRSSADASTWTSWSSYQTPASGGAFDISAIVDSNNGLNKYLQVETTLENTDGVSTPTVDSYSAAYHTNLAPSTPTNLTAVVGE